VMDKGWEQVVGVLGILQAGAGYLPLSPDIPQDRLWHLLESGKVNWVLTQSWLTEQLEWPASTPCIPVDHYELNEASAAPLLQIQKSADLAFMTYTPELADAPKGTITNHQEAVSTIAGINHRIDIDHRDRVFPMSRFSDDLWAYTIFGTLAAGGTLIMPGSTHLQTPDQWESWMNELQVTIWTTTQSALSTLIKFVEEGGHSLPGELRCVLLSEGEGENENVQIISLG
jgi:pyochelin synthetase